MDGSLASLRPTRADGDVSLRLRGGRGASVTSHASWGAVVEKNGVGVHARPELGGLRHGCWRTAHGASERQGAVSSFMSSAVRGEVMEGAGLGQLGVSFATLPSPAREQHGGVRPSTATGLLTKWHASSLLW